MSTSAEVARAARAVRGVGEVLKGDGRRLGEGRAALASTTRQAANSGNSPAVQRSAQAAERRIDCAAPAPDILQATCSSLESLGGTGESIASRLQGHEERLQRLQSHRRILLNDPDPTTPAALANIETQITQTRRAIERDSDAWEEACNDTARSLNSQANELQQVSRLTRFYESYPVRSLLNAPSVVRGAEFFHGLGVLATNWVRHTHTRAARLVASARAGVGSLVRTAAGVAAGNWRLTQGGRFVRAAGSALKLAATPFRATAAARDAIRGVRASYAPRLERFSSRMADGRHLMRHGTAVSRVAGNVARVAAVPQDLNVLRNGSSYEGARGSVDRGMAGVGLAGAAAAAGGLAIKGVAAVGIGAGLVVAAPVLAKGALIAGAGAAVWGLGNLAWDATTDLRSRASKKVSEVASSAKEAASNAKDKVCDVGAKIAGGASSVVASASGGLKRLGSVFGGG